MYSSSIVATVAFVLALAGLVAVVDRWREARANRRAGADHRLRLVAGGGGTATGALQPGRKDRRAA